MFDLELMQYFCPLLFYKSCFANIQSNAVKKQKQIFIGQFQVATSKHATINYKHADILHAYQDIHHVNYKLHIPRTLESHVSYTRIRLKVYKPL